MIGLYQIRAEISYSWKKYTRICYASGITNLTQINENGNYFNIMHSDTTMNHLIIIVILL